MVNMVQNANRMTFHVGSWNGNMLFGAFLEGGGN